MFKQEIFRKVFLGFFFRILFEFLLQFSFEEGFCQKKIFFPSKYFKKFFSHVWKVFIFLSRNSWGFGEYIFIEDLTYSDLFLSLSESLYLFWVSAIKIQSFSVSKFEIDKFLGLWSGTQAPKWKTKNLSLWSRVKINFTVFWFKLICSNQIVNSFHFFYFN